MPENRGYYKKYNVSRTDDKPGHEDCVYFTFDVTHDPYAKFGLRAYAEVVKLDYPLLSEALYELVGKQLGNTEEQG